jgi:hypothetical protein
LRLSWQESVYNFPLSDGYLGSIPPGPFADCTKLGEPEWVSFGPEGVGGEVLKAATLPPSVLLETTSKFHTTVHEVLVKVTVAAEVYGWAPEAVLVLNGHMTNYTRMRPTSAGGSVAYFAVRVEREKRASVVVSAGGVVSVFGRSSTASNTLEVQHYQITQNLRDVEDVAGGWRSSHLPHTCLTLASHLPHTCFTLASHLFHLCFTLASHLFHLCFTLASHLFHLCFTLASHLRHAGVMTKACELHGSRH